MSTTVIPTPAVQVERYDHQGTVRDWPAMRGQRFSAGDYVVYVSDCGHVDLSEAWVGDPASAGRSLVQAEHLLAALTASVEAARAVIGGDLS